MVGSLIKRRSHVYNIKVKVIRRLSGLKYLRLSVYQKGTLVEVLGFFDIKNSFWFVKFHDLFYYVRHGLNFLSWLTKCKIINKLGLASVIFKGFHDWLLHVPYVLIRFSFYKKYWQKLLVRTTRLITRFMMGYNVDKSALYLHRRIRIMQIKISREEDEYYD